jgi:hypothetical protein
VRFDSWRTLRLIAVVTRNYGHGKLKINPVFFGTRKQGNALPWTSNHSGFSNPTLDWAAARPARLPPGRLRIAKLFRIGEKPGTRPGFPIFKTHAVWLQLLGACMTRQIR